MIQLPNESQKSLQNWVWLKNLIGRATGNIACINMLVSMHNNHYGLLCQQIWTKWTDLWSLQLIYDIIMCKTTYLYQRLKLRQINTTISRRMYVQCKSICGLKTVKKAGHNGHKTVSIKTMCIKKQVTLRTSENISLWMQKIEMHL